MSDTPSDTSGPEYTQRLQASVQPRHGWRRWLDPQRPYRWNIRRMQLGRVLDVGCGVGRNLAHLDGNGVGLDHNPASIAMARARGLTAYVTEEFAGSADATVQSFDTVLFAHVLEHMTPGEAAQLIRAYLPYLRVAGQVVVICPQERGQRSDATHVTFMPAQLIETVLRDAGVTAERVRSFPFPTAIGRWFTHNETIVIGRPAPR
jgi:2-polyprenyl-3-methyl-5-hydroxy-6-metoxy-1,4-benzoquinol methylase